MGKTGKKEFQTTEAFVIQIKHEDVMFGHETEVNKRLASPVDSLAWEVKTIVTPELSPHRWNVHVCVSAVRPGDDPVNMLRPVLAKGKIFILMTGTTESCTGCGWSADARIRYCASPGCQVKLPVATVVDFPLTETCFFVMKEPLKTDFATFDIQVCVSLTHYEELPEPELTGCEQGKSLSPRLEGLLASGSLAALADFTFLVSGERIPAHRAILGAASDVFLTMFTIDSEDRRTGRVEIKDVGPASFKEMLRNLYTDLEPRWTIKGADKEGLLMELLYLAVKYDLRKLLGVCKARLLATLSVGNVCRRLRVVDVECPSLVPLIADPFVKEHHQEIAASAAWLDFEAKNAVLAARVVRMATASP